MAKKYLKVMFGTTSGANKELEYKLNEVNISNNWNPNSDDPKEMGGFNFSTEDKILRWLVRGDTLYDVEIPKDAEVIDCPSESAPHGVFRTNKIILSNPRAVTDEISMQLYEKSTLPEKSYFKAMAGLCVRGHINTAKKILEEKINNENINTALSEFKDFVTPKDKEFNEELLSGYCKEIYDLLKKYSKEW